jgi:hypothetical protein
MMGDDHSIDVNKGVGNTLNANVCTISVVKLKASKLELRPLTNLTSFSNLENNDKHL